MTPSGGATSGSGYNGHNADNPRRGTLGQGRPRGSKTSEKVMRRLAAGKGGSSAEYRKLMRGALAEELGPNDMAAIVAEVVKQAKDGDKTSQRLAFEYGFGKPTVSDDLPDDETLTAEQVRTLAAQVKLFLVAKDGEDVEEGDDDLGPAEEGRAP